MRMNKAEKKFRFYAILVIFILLVVLLSVINGVNFTMAAQDADMITERLSGQQGAFNHEDPGPEGGKPWKSGESFDMGPMGPDSPELKATTRYFTFAFKDAKKGSEDAGRTIAFNISAVTEEEAREWARGLLGEKTGWTRGTYRYRVYEISDMTYVTVIDQGRELLPSYRILIISAVGLLLSIIIGWFLLLGISRKLYAPLVEADRKQKNFIRNANKEFRLPLTIISGNTELTERTYGPDDSTRSTHRQLGKLNELISKLGTIGIYKDDASPEEIQVSEYLTVALDQKKDSFRDAGINLTTDIAPDIRLKADPEAIRQLIDELIVNALKYSGSKAGFTLREENGHILIETKNDTTLPDGAVNQIFDRFTVLENAEGKEESAGLGLSYVKQIVTAHNGRASAKVSEGIFTLRITV